MPTADNDPLTQKIIGFAIEVHRQLGPGLLESAYEECLCLEFRQQNLEHKRQFALPITYKGIALDAAYRVDLIIADRLLVELKTVERTLPVHEAQILTYMRLSGMPVGLLLNFNVALLPQGLKRIVL